jgi:hypothetical protein
MKLKINESIRRTASDPCTLRSSFSCIRPQGHNNLLLVPINRIVGKWCSLSLLHYHFAFSKLRVVCQELYLK